MRAFVYHKYRRELETAAEEFDSLSAAAANFQRRFDTLGKKRLDIVHTASVFVVVRFRHPRAKGCASIYVTRQPISLAAAVSGGGGSVAMLVCLHARVPPPIDLVATTLGLAHNFCPFAPFQMPWLARDFFYAGEQITTDDTDNKWQQLAA